MIHVPPVTYGLIALGLAIIYLFPRVTRAFPVAAGRDRGGHNRVGYVPS